MLDRFSITCVGVMTVGQNAISEVQRCNRNMRILLICVCVCVGFSVVTDFCLVDYTDPFPHEMYQKIIQRLHAAQLSVLAEKRNHSCVYTNKTD